jgi:molybdate transport system regulatory protein
MSNRQPRPSQVPPSGPKRRARKSAAPGFSIYNRLMVFSENHCALGPGRVMIMEQIQRSGNLSQAARDLGISYMKAWMLARSLNQSFAKPVIEMARGGQRGGGAVLTPTGEEILALYRRMQALAAEAVAPAGRELKRYFRGPE